MKKFILISMLMIFSLAMFNSCGSNDTKTEDKTEYSCPMHKEIKSDKAGTCSVCGMDLVKN